MAAFAEFVRRKANWLFRRVRPYVPDDDDALDATQEILIAVWRNVGRYDPKWSPNQWLSVIVLNKCRDRARRTAVRRKLIAYNASDTRLSASQEASLIKQQALRRLEFAVEQLPHNYRNAIVLTIFEGHSHREAGQLLGVSEKAIEMRLQHATEKLAGILRASDLGDLFSC